MISGGGQAGEKGLIGSVPSGARFSRISVLGVQSGGGQAGEKGEKGEIGSSFFAVVPYSSGLIRNVRNFLHVKEGS